MPGRLGRPDSPSRQAQQPSSAAAHAAQRRQRSARRSDRPTQPRCRAQGPAATDCTLPQPLSPHLQSSRDKGAHGSQWTLKCSISAALPGPGPTPSDRPAAPPPSGARRSSCTGLCSTSCCRRSTSALVVALISRHWQPRGTCARVRPARPAAAPALAPPAPGRAVAWHRSLASSAAPPPAPTSCPLRRGGPKFPISLQFRGARGARGREHGKVRSSQLCRRPLARQRRVHAGAGRPHQRRERGEVRGVAGHGQHEVRLVQHQRAQARAAHALVGR